MAKGSKDDEDRLSTIVSSFSSNSIKDSEATVNMVDLLVEVSKRLQRQEQRQKQQE